MNITASRLTSTAGLCAAAAGAIFIGVQIGHPPADVEHLVTTDVLIRESAKVLMCVLALIGFTGMFLRHRRSFGVLGLAGFSLLTVGYLALFAVQCIVGYVLPTVAQFNPGYVQDVLDAAVGGQPERRHRPHAAAADGRRHRLPARRSAVRHRDVPRRRARAAGPQSCSPTAPPPPWRWPCCRSPSTARSRCPRASR